MEIKGKTWKIPTEKFEEIEKIILSYEPDKKPTPSQYELWRYNVGESQFTMYTSGKLVNNKITSDIAFELRKKIDLIAGDQFKSTDREILLGLDETGKGEIFGHEVLCCALFPSNISKEIENIVGQANTKEHRTFEYWDELFIRLDPLQSKGLEFQIQAIPPEYIDKYHINKIMDLFYKKILFNSMQGKNISECSVVIDNYKIGDNLLMYLTSLEKQDAKVIIEEKADDSFLEAKLASILAKREREKIMRGINKYFKINDLAPGSGSASDKNTIVWLNAWKASGKNWPAFVKQSFSTVRKIDRKTEKVVKLDPPIKPELISENSQKEFEEGKLSSSTLRISCPNCFSELQAIKITPDTGTRSLDSRCTKCNETIPDLNTTLQFYSGIILPDSSAIRHGLLSKDLYGGKFFENFNILIHKRVREECDNRGGKAEMGKITDIASFGRIKITELPDEINRDRKPDEEIVNAAKKYKGILLTKDMGEYLDGIGSDIFVIAST